MALRRSLADIGKWAGSQVSCGLHRSLGGRANGRFGILMYHRIAPLQPAAPGPTWNVTPAALRQQLEGLLQRGYQIWPLLRLIDHCLRVRPIPDKTAVVTFDDGYESVYLH